MGPETVDMGSGRSLRTGAAMTPEREQAIRAWAELRVPDPWQAHPMVVELLEEIERLRDLVERAVPLIADHIHTIDVPEAGQWLRDVEVKR